MRSRLYWGAIAFALLLATVLADDPAGSRDLRLRPTQVFKPVSTELPAGNAGLFVGINRFTHDQGLLELSFAVHDAVETAYLFTLELKLIPAPNCYVLISGEPHAAAVKEHLEQLRRAGAIVKAGDRSEILGALIDVTELAKERSNLLVCSFSSHGFDDHGEPFVMPSDGRRKLLKDTAISLKTIENQLQVSIAGHRLLLVDACQERVSARSAGEGVGQPVTAAFVAALQQPTGQAKLASCSPGEFSFEHAALGGVGHGVFTYEFLQSLRGGARADAKNLVRLGDVADYVAQNVTAWTTENKRPRQTPFLQSPVATRDLPLASKADDLVALLAQFEALPADEAIPTRLRAGLLQQLRSAAVKSDGDRKLMRAMRDFLDGRMDKEFFVAFLQYDQRRWSAAPMIDSPPPAVVAVPGVAPVTPPAAMPPVQPPPPSVAKPDAPTTAAASQPATPPPTSTPSHRLTGLRLKSGQLQFHDNQGQLTWSYGGGGQKVLDFTTSAEGEALFACTERDVVRLSKIDGREVWRQTARRGATFSSLALDSGGATVSVKDVNRDQHVYWTATGQYQRTMAAAPRPSVGQSQIQDDFEWNLPDTTPFSAQPLDDNLESFDPGEFQRWLDEQPIVDPASSAAPWQWTVKVRTARPQVKVGSRVVATVTYGDVLRVLQQNEEWYWVEVPVGTQSVKGWISKQDVEQENFSPSDF